jgi:predicted TIM-barrel fold metal-dependent hydrolase
MHRLLWAPLLVVTVAASAAQEPKLFDGHIHYSANAWEEYPPEKAIALLREAGIEKALLSSTPIEGTLKLIAADPERFVPELRVYRKATSLETWYAERATWWRDPETPAFLERELKRGIYKGIGEFHLNGKEADSAVIKRVVGIAVERNLILHAHCDAEAIEKLFAHNGKARILWAHAGITTQVEVIEKWLARYPALWVELSYRYDIMEGDTLSPAWRGLFERFPDRFVTGSDTWVASRWGEIPTIAVWTRQWLVQLPKEIADQIAWKTGQRLYGF